MPIGGIRGGGNRPIVPVPTKPRPPAFVPPKCDLVIPDNLGRPPTLADVTVKAGFDGRTPQQVAQLVAGNSTTPIAAQNSSFVQQTITDVHKAFTIAVNNAFVANTPFAKLAAQYPGASFAILGTMSEVHPSLVQVTVNGQPPMTFAPAPGGTYQKLDKNPYQVVMQADLRLGKSPAVRVTYPKWSVPALSGPTGTVTEG